MEKIIDPSRFYLARKLKMKQEQDQYKVHPRNRDFEIEKSLLNTKFSTEPWNLVKAERHLSFYSIRTICSTFHT